MHGIIQVWAVRKRGSPCLYIGLDWPPDRAHYPSPAAPLVLLIPAGGASVLRRDRRMNSLRLPKNKKPPTWRQNESDHSLAARSLSPLELRPITSASNGGVLYG